MLLLGGPVIGILLFLLVSASDNSAAFEQNYLCVSVCILCVF